MSGLLTQHFSICVNSECLTQLKETNKPKPSCIDISLENVTFLFGNLKGMLAFSKLMYNHNFFSAYKNLLTTFGIVF